MFARLGDVLFLFGDGLFLSCFLGNSPTSPKDIFPMTTGVVMTMMGASVLSNSLTCNLVLNRNLYFRANIHDKDDFLLPCHDENKISMNLRLMMRSGRLFYYFVHTMYLWAS